MRTGWSAGRREPERRGGGGGRGRGRRGSGAAGAARRAPSAPGGAAAPRRGRCSTIRVTITRRISTLRGAGGRLRDHDAACPCPSAGSAPARIWNASNAAIAKNSPADPAITGNGPGFLTGSRFAARGLGTAGSFAVGASWSKCAGAARGGVGAQPARPRSRDAVRRAAAAARRTGGRRLGAARRVAAGACPSGQSSSSPPRPRPWPESSS